MSMIDVSDTERRIAAKVDPKVTGGMALSTNRTGGVSFTSMTEVMEFSKVLALSNVGVRKHLRGNVGACLALTVQAIEWEMSPFAVANKSYLVNDQIAYEAQLLNAVVLRRAPIQGRFKVEYTGAGDMRVCRVWARLRDEDEIVEYVSPPFSKIQPKNSPLWKSDPDQQQFYMASRALCRRHFPDVLLGVYAVDELIDENIAPQSGGPRDVTPRTLAAKLDALAGVPAHDPETGEITEPTSSGDGEIPPAKSEVEAGEANSTAASPAENKAPEKPADGHPRAEAPKEAAKAESPPTQAATPAPSTPEEYRAHVLAYVAEATSASALEAKWRAKDIAPGDKMGDRSLRQKLNIDQETFNELEGIVKARCVELKGAPT